MEVKVCYMFRHKSAVSVFMCKLNKILRMQLCMEMHGCVLLYLQQNIYYEIRCCDIANKMCCANKNDYVIMYM